MATDPSPQPERIAHYAGLIHTKKFYRLDIEVYEDGIRLSKSFKYNKPFFERPGQRLDVFWKYSRQGRIISVEMRLHPDEETLTTYLELQGRNGLELFWTEAPVKYKELPHVTRTIHSSLNLGRYEDKYAGLVNFGHELAKTTISKLNNKKTKRMQAPPKDSKPLEQILNEPGVFSALDTIGSLSTTIPHIQGDIFTFHY